MTRMLIAAAALTLLPAVAGAQARVAAAAAPPVVQPPPPEPVRVQPLPEQVATIPPMDPRRDLFEAAPATYAPRFDRLLTPAEMGLSFPIFGATVWPTFVGPAPPPPPVVVVVVPPPQASSTAAPPAVTPPAATLPAAAPPPTLGPKKTLYVIPRCYAGDKRPRPDQLRRGCRLSDLRVISPDL